MKKRKNQHFSQGMQILSELFFIKYFSVDKLTIFYRKMAENDFDFGGPWNPVDMTFHKISNCFNT